MIERSPFFFFLPHFDVELFPLKGNVCQSLRLFLDIWRPKHSSALIFASLLDNKMEANGGIQSLNDGLQVRGRQ